MCGIDSRNSSRARAQPEPEPTIAGTDNSFTVAVPNAERSVAVAKLIVNPMEHNTQEDACYHNVMGETQAAHEQLGHKTVRVSIAPSLYEWALERSRLDLDALASKRG